MFTSRRHGCVFCTKDLFFFVLYIIIITFEFWELRSAASKGLVKHNTLEIWLFVGFLLPGSGGVFSASTYIQN